MRCRFHQTVRECAVVLQEYGEGDARLVAHVLAHPGADAAELRQHLRAALPDYMVPSAFLLHERLPRTASGKIDRRQLPAPDPLGAPEPGADFTAPRTELEREVAMHSTSALLGSWVYSAFSPPDQIKKRAQGW